MKLVIKIVIILIILIAALFIVRVLSGPEDDWLCVDGNWLKHGNPSGAMPAGGCGNGQVIKNFFECLDTGFPVMESYPRKCRDDKGNEFVEDIGNELAKQDLIRIDNPRPNQKVTSPLAISGQARGYWFFRAVFPVKLLDKNRQVIAASSAQAQGEWMTDEFVPFKAVIEFNVATGEQGFLVLEKDNPSDLSENADELVVPVVFGESETLTVKVFFNNSQLDPEFSCNKVFPVARKIIKTEAPARKALEELLQGPTAEEQSQGFISNINDRVEIQSLKIENGIAKVDFDEQLEFQVGGSCRVAAISAQITETLKQFATVNQVVISVNGRTEDILQP